MTLALLVWSDLFKLYVFIITVIADFETIERFRALPDF